MIVSERNRTEKYLIKVYEDIDGYEVIKELLLHKGEDVCKDLRVDKILLDQMALIVYGLKSNATNKLYVGFALDRFYKRHDLVTPNGSIKVPVKIYDEVVETNNRYRRNLQI